MEYISVQEAARKWKVSERMVRKYCTNGCIPDAHHEGKSWLIPSTAKKPKHPGSSTPKAPSPPKTAPVPIQPMPPLAQKLCAQQTKRNFHGLYDYTILNLTYSSCRMASCRLTCAQVESLIKTGKAQASFEPLKVSDLIEAANHCECVDIILQHIMEPLTQTMIKNLHRRLFAGTVDEQNGKVTAGAYRKSSTIIKGRKVPPAQEIAAHMSRLIDDYEKAAEHSLRDILNYHVVLEGIAPFDDGNGRVGRLILFKECLRHGVMPFILDDKRRTRYLQGLRDWDEDPWPLMEVVSEAQQRYSTQIELQKLKASELRYQRLYHRVSE